ncbi:helix-turn-helix transcriptional regulator [Actinomyces radicidentis]|uniref:helix-turn-helix domain-containing protein n=1 Tax=Actinomyces radicidentis TaxID=111015 RepID=UPI0028EF39C8|nr:helix-turn-helix transcriptional regulator [Actinomyces radicidentis]
MPNQSSTVPALEGFDAAVGFTVQQLLFANGVTRARLGELLGLPGPSVSNRLRGKVRWTAGDLAVTAETFGIAPSDLYPTHSPDGTWVPAAYVPGQQKTPAPVGAGAPTADAALVAGAGFEPATSRSASASSWRSPR